jgi:hypothetical protein
MTTMRNRPTTLRLSAARGVVAAWLLTIVSLATAVPRLQAEAPLPSDQPIFAPIGTPIHAPVPGPNRDGSLEGMPFQDFSVQQPCNSFPDCPFPVLSWRQGPCAGDRGCGAMDLPAHAVRKALWYVSADFVALRRDPRERQAFTQIGNGGTGPTALSSQDFDYPLDAGGQFLLGHRFTDRLSFEASYLGSFEWNDQTYVRSNDANTLGGQGNLSSPFSEFGFVPTPGLDFNNFVFAETSTNFENLELNFRYRPEFVPYGPFDVSFLYGVRYIHYDETLGYRSESDFPAPGGSINTLDVATDNDMFGAQIGLTGHTLIYPSFWIDTDIKGAMYNNHARQRTVYENTENGALTSFATAAQRDDTAFSGDVRIIGNYQLLERLTLRAGYQVTWVTSAATAVSNFETDIDVLRLGPGDLRTTDTITYHGPVLGITYVR